MHFLVMGEAWLGKRKSSPEQAGGQFIHKKANPCWLWTNVSHIFWLILLSLLQEPITVKLKSHLHFIML